MKIKIITILSLILLLSFSVSKLMCSDIITSNNVETAVSTTTTSTSTSTSTTQVIYHPKIVGDIRDNKLYISRDQLAKDIKGLCDLIKQNNKIEDFYGMVAITRGGLPIAATASRVLDITRIDTISIASYTDDNKQSAIKIIKAMKEDTDKKWLVFDDLSDSGDTIEAVRKILPNSFIATVYAKPKGADAPDIYFKKCKQDTWIVFPDEE